MNIPTSGGKFPGDIYQALVDIDCGKWLVDKNVIEALNNLNCNYLELRLFGNPNIPNLLNLLANLEGTSIIGVDIYLKYTSTKRVHEINETLNNYLRINRLYYYDAPYNSLLNKKNKNFYSLKTYFLKQNIHSCINCGVISKNYFETNVGLFTKSNNYNTCLMGKVSFDIDGNIKNCPSMIKSYGNIKHSSIERIVKSKAIKNIWNIKKENIEVCCDCEFRHICTDCRAYLKNHKNPLSKPLKCGYNPYTGIWRKWQEDSENQKSITFYKMNNFLS